MRDAMIDDFRRACQNVIDFCKNGYAVSYARVGKTLHDRRDIRVQALYILNNITHWRGPIATTTREKLKEISKLHR